MAHPLFFLLFNNPYNSEFRLLLKKILTILNTLFSDELASVLDADSVGVAYSCQLFHERALSECLPNLFIRHCESQADSVPSVLQGTFEFDVYDLALVVADDVLDVVGCLVEQDAVDEAYITFIFERCWPNSARRQFSPLRRCRACCPRAGYPCARCPADRARCSRSG